MNFKKLMAHFLVLHLLENGSFTSWEDSTRLLIILTVLNIFEGLVIKKGTRASALTLLLLNNVQAYGAEWWWWGWSWMGQWRQEAS